MADHRILVLADDLTVALEVAGKFSRASVSWRVRTSRRMHPLDFYDAAGGLVDTEYRWD